MTTPPTPTPTSAPTLPELRAALRLAVEAYPECRRGLCAALADIDRALGEEPQRPPRERRYGRRAVDGLR